MDSGKGVSNSATRQQASATTDLGLADLLLELPLGVLEIGYIIRQAADLSRRNGQRHANRLQPSQEGRTSFWTLSYLAMTVGSAPPIDSSSACFSARLSSSASSPSSSALSFCEGERMGNQSAARESRLHSRRQAGTHHAALLEGLAGLLVQFVELRLGLVERLGRLLLLLDELGGD